MLHSLGKKAERDPKDVVGRLLDCHARMREMASLAARLGSEAGASDDERVETARRVSRYFTRALPLHVRDEEDSIAPRLAAASGEVAAAIERMRAEHAEHEGAVAALVAACDAVGDEPRRWEVLAPALADHAAAVARALVTHLEQEERDVFPRVAALDDAARAAIVAEMDARREGAGGGGGGGGGGRGGGGGGGGRGGGGGGGGRGGGGGGGGGRD